MNTRDEAIKKLVEELEETNNNISKSLKRYVFIYQLCLWLSIISITLIVISCILILKGA